MAMTGLISIALIQLKSIPISLLTMMMMVYKLEVWMKDSVSTIIGFGVMMTK
jgi:hypothetical protein